MDKLDLKWSKLLPLTKEEIDKLDSNIGGVYRFSQKKLDGKYYVFFVGSAGNLKEKLLGHLSNNNLSVEKYIKQEGDFVFRYSIIESEDIRKAVEKQMYKHYAPEYNLEEPISPLSLIVNLN